MLDHVGFSVGDYEQSKAFYAKTLAPLGLTLLMEFGNYAGFGADPKPFFWIDDRKDRVRGGVHLAFAADQRETVDAFHAAGLAAGGIDNGAPGVREDYHPGYYGAYLIDPDGNNIEAVCHELV